MISGIALLGTLLGLGIPAAMVLIPWTIVTGNADLLYRVSQGINRAALRMARVRMVVEGRENVPPRTACIFMANHISNLDPPALLPQIPGRTSAFLKRGLMKIPVLGYAFKLGDFIPVERDGRPESARESTVIASGVLARGLHITIFVEGTRSRDGKMLPFKRGPFYLAMETGVPCIPVSIYGTEKLMRKGSARIEPGTAHIRFHPPLCPRDYATRDELMEAMRANIASGLPEWMRS
jgi:1-acyl-sn-glycerol-3-phosphate acyltransferase